MLDSSTISVHSTNVKQTWTASPLYSLNGRHLSVDTQQMHYAIMTSLLRQNAVILTLFRSFDVIQRYYYVTCQGNLPAVMDVQETGSGFSKW